MTLSSYPSIRQLGHAEIKGILEGPVVVQEKVDGSQASFGFIDGILQARSKSVQLNLELENFPGLFSKAVQTIKEKQPLLTSGYIYRGEVLEKPKHNTLGYSRVPKGNIILFDIENLNIGPQTFLTPEEALIEATRIGLEIVPLFHEGTIKSIEEVKSLLETTSVLGGVKIEGIVVKNYSRFTVDGKVMMGKYVSEAFKETNHSLWTNRGTVIDELVSMLKTKGRWNKSIQHLSERGELTNSPKDIGPLLKEINQDILGEEKELIKEKLFEYYWKEISRKVTYGFPEWYKEELLKREFSSQEND